MLLAKELQKDIPAVEAIPNPSACITDGMSMVQRLKGDHKTFAEIADAVMTTILREGATSKRVDVAFEVYRKMSIENTEREKRGGYQEMSAEIYSQITKYNNRESIYQTLRIKSSLLELSLMKGRKRGSGKD